jgi:hypothetical protein
MLNLFREPQPKSPWHTWSYPTRAEGNIKLDTKQSTVNFFKQFLLCINIFPYKPYEGLILNAKPSYVTVFGVHFYA